MLVSSPRLCSRARIALLCCADRGPRAPSSCTGADECGAMSGTMVGRELQPAAAANNNAASALRIMRPRLRECAPIVGALPYRPVIRYALNSSERGGGSSPAYFANDAARPKRAALSNKRSKIVWSGLRYFTRMSFLTDLTPSTPLATFTAVDSLLAELTKPLSWTMPLNVSTLISADLSVDSLRMAAFTLVV